ncbi:uncharacterized protein IUM83_18101 [Phytophthora cinnamomi]|uniref:uncharacterized protein n=1 Tax=Phytophthora cinnamomi TaxID=4785 RepID=UPI0035598C58|nr:hypothetical protein IUM83_18101 [Phytophthora cinnamomi]
MAASGQLFQGTAWLLLEPKTTFYSPRYSSEALSVRRQSLPFWDRPQVVLQLGQTDFLVQFRPGGRGQAQRRPQGDQEAAAADDGAFAALERAQQSRDKMAALELYKEAESGFYEAEKVVLDERSREFLRARRRLAEDH